MYVRRSEAFIDRILRGRGPGRDFGRGLDVEGSETAQLHPKSLVQPKKKGRSALESHVDGAREPPSLAYPLRLVEYFGLTDVGRQTAGDLDRVDEVGRHAADLKVGGIDVDASLE